MRDLEILSIIRSQRACTVAADSKFSQKNESLLDSYNQEPYGNEEEGRSQVVASDHFDTLESDMPSRARIFLGSNPVMTFKALNSSDPDDVKEAEHKTKLADYYIRHQPESFKTIFDWLKEPGMAKCSVVKYYFEEKTKVYSETWKGMSIDELTLQIDDLERQAQVSNVKVSAQKELDDGTFEVSFKVIKSYKKLRIVNVPIENFGITKNVQFTQDAPLAFDDVEKTKGELIAEGYEKSMVEGLRCTSNMNRTIKNKRSQDMGSYGLKGMDDHWTSDTVLVTYNYILIDIDGDGIPERRMITTCGDVILDNEPYDRVPYAILTEIPMPHVLIGKSRGERAAEIQRQKTPINRAINDNIYAHSRPRMAYDDSAGGTLDGSRVDIDELMGHEIGGLISTDGPPSGVLMPIIEPYIGSDALQIIQYMESQRSASLGTTQGSQGLDSDKFYRETATRFNGVADENAAKAELVARVFAETGFRELYEGVIWTAQRYQDTAVEIEVLGEQFIVDPRSWRREHYASSSVGLGAGDSEKSVQNIAAVFEVQMRLSQDPRYAGLVDAKKIHSTMNDMFRALGKPDVSQYINDPTIPGQQMQAMLEQMMMENQQLKGQIQAAQNELAQAAQIQAQAKLMAEKNKREIEAAKLAEDSRQFDESIKLEQNKAITDSALKATDIEQKYSVDVPGALT